LVANQPARARNHSQANAREDIRIITLRGRESFTANRDRIKRTSTGKNCPTVGVLISLFRSAFRHRRRVRERENNWSVVDPGSGLEHGGREGARFSGRANQGSRPDSFDYDNSVRQEFMITRKRVLIVCKIIAPVYDQTLGIHKPAAPARLALRQTVLDHRRND
jgi:hypothetical protein